MSTWTPKLKIKYHLQLLKKIKYLGINIFIYLHAENYTS